MKIRRSLLSLGIVASMAFSTLSLNAFAKLPMDLKDTSADCVWKVDPDVPVDQQKSYWYEMGVRQGTKDDPNGVMGENDDGTLSNRGREICDLSLTENNVKGVWFWLDSIYDGAKATSKEVWMPYVFQDEASWKNADGTWKEDKLKEVADNSDRMSNAVGMGQCVIDQIKKHGTKEGGKWVRYNADGRMIKGWYTEDGTIKPDQKGNTYFYDIQTGLMAKGDVKIEGKTYHFDEITGVLDPNSVKEDVNSEYEVNIKSCPGNFAIEGDMELSGTGNGYHAKFAISNGGSGTISLGLQYDVNSGNDACRGKVALMVENATPIWQQYYWPGEITVGDTSGKAHILFAVDTISGIAYGYINGQSVGSWQNDGMKNSNYDYIQIKAEGAADDGSAVVAAFKNITVKHVEDASGKIGYISKGKVFCETSSPTFESHVEPGNEGYYTVLGNNYYEPEGYTCSYVTGVNDNIDWDVQAGVQAYIYYIKGYTYLALK